MPIHFDQFKAFLSKFGYTYPDLNTLVSMCVLVKCSKGEIISKSGIKHNQTFFICKGLDRFAHSPV